ncbi:Uncharacterised protein [Anaerobiospirillum thomasii]|uniref:Uncharacterized protein n=2 Tax=Anaerobiospirillum thomasii TaxID=179995 RepID=A0A2X0WYI7_9GAMM|nr:Uncharacterised protein [Anaerobiospirillum thomasii]SPT70601.1 Uncharacterised protein [Anaerobiospirillum thomasii]
MTDVGLTLDFSDKEYTMLSDNDDNYSSANKWNQARRLEFIDFRLGCDGKVNRKDLVEFFNISIPQASLDLSKYNELVADSSPPRKNLVYDRHLKFYIKTPDYRPLFPKICSPENYLNDLLSLASGDLVKSRNFFGFVPNVGMAAFNPPRRNISAEVLYNLLEAIRTQKALHISYYSLTSSKHSDQLIAPHGLAFDGMRWHVRAYCYDRHDFRDYVLSRIIKCSEPSIQAPNDRYTLTSGGETVEVGTSGRDDKAWNELVDLVLKANPELPELTRKAIEFDYGMGDKGYIIYPCRRALLFYALQYLRLTEADKALPAIYRQIVLDNEAEVIRRMNGGN